MVFKLLTSIFSVFQDSMNNNITVVHEQWGLNESLVFCLIFIIWDTDLCDFLFISRDTLNYYYFILGVINPSHIKILLF